MARPHVPGGPAPALRSGFSIRASRQIMSQINLLRFPVASCRLQSTSRHGSDGLRARNSSPRLAVYCSRPVWPRERPGTPEWRSASHRALKPPGIRGERLTCTSRGIRRLQSSAKRADSVRAMFSRMSGPCFAQLAATSLTKFSENRFLAPIGLPAMFPLCPGFHVTVSSC
jgi:hypothetical protein